MRWTYDASLGALYVYLRDTEEKIAGQVELPDGVVVDVDSEGRAVGIEILAAYAPWSVGSVAVRFDLDDDTVAYLAWLASSDLLHVRPVERDLEVTGVTSGASENRQPFELLSA